MEEKIADLQISLRRREQGVYAIEMRFTQPGSDEQVQVGINAPLPVSFDFQDLRGKIGANAAYAAALTDSLFEPEEFRRKFQEARAATQNQPLRIRLQLDYADPDLNSLYWEALLDPETRSPLFTGDRVFFSRYLSSSEFRSIRTRGKRDLRALLSAAGPLDLPKFQLDPVDVEKELAAIITQLGDIPFQCLPGNAGIPTSPSAANGHCSILQLSGLLRQATQDEKGFDVLYLVCHGTKVKGEPFLYLEDENGSVAIVSGLELVRVISEMTEPPRLVVLVSCEGAKEGSSTALTALGPLLAKAGVPAVIAMQGQISMNTMAIYMPALFEQLSKHGRIDQAMAFARGKVLTAKCADYWMPVLYMRLESGRLWKLPTSPGASGSFEMWPGLLLLLKKKNLTPFIGPGVLTQLVGSPQDIAAEWSARYGYPLRPFERTHLPQVAQFVQVQQKVNGFITDQLVFDMRSCVQERFHDRLPADLQHEDAALDDILEHIAGERVKAGRVEPHHLLAKFELPLYITANYDNLLVTALKAAGKQPEVVICPWNEDVVQQDTVFQTDSKYIPSPERPLVYHLFGRFDFAESLVIREDDYFDYLVGVAKNWDLVPVKVKEAFAKTSLLFVGFQLDEWDFRVIHRSLRAQLGSRNNRNTSIGVQVDLEGGEIQDPERARNYLKEYYQQNADLSLFWGSPDEFMQELAERWEKPA